LFFADYPNIELKLLAWYLDHIGHPEMAEVFRDGADLHRTTAAMIFKKEIDEVTDGERQIAKRLNFSIVYGGGIPTLLDQGMAKNAVEALSLLRKFHDAWPAIGWESKRRPADAGTLVWYIKQRVAERGYVTTLWGRHLHPRSVHSSLNALVQGCAADLMKWALIEVHKWTIEADLQSHLINVVHDEVMLDAVKKELPLLAVKVPELMTFKAIEDVVPIRPEPDLSFTNWGQKAPYQEVING
jgi:DNA polymerase-1